MELDTCIIAYVCRNCSDRSFEKIPIAEGLQFISHDCLVCKRRLTKHVQAIEFTSETREEECVGFTTNQQHRRST